MRSVRLMPGWLAMLQLTPYYNHIPIPGIGRYQMFRSWGQYEDGFPS